MVVRLIHHASIRAQCKKHGLRPSAASQRLAWPDQLRAFVSGRHLLSRASLGPVSAMQTNSFTLAPRAQQIGASLRISSPLPRATVRSSEPLLFRAVARGPCSRAISTLRSTEAFSCSAAASFEPGAPALRRCRFAITWSIASSLVVTARGLTTRSTGPAGTGLLLGDRRWRRAG